MASAHRSFQRASSLLNKGVPSVFKSTSSNPHLPAARWLFGCTGLVAGIVHVGGVTRLTKSGLSMTDWKPLGSLPPMNLEEWNVEFDRYKQFPEFAQRRSMDLEEFKSIFYWEWGHRMLGRTVGVAFAVPWAYYSLRYGRTRRRDLVKMIPTEFQPRLALLFTLGGTQGLVGWWMVRSGLGEDRRDDRKEIRVSPYRLATHLCVAATTFSLLLHTSLDLLHHHNVDKINTLTDALKKSAIHRQALITHASRCRHGAVVLTGLTGLTLASGAFVAGNDAGRAYNNFPKMTDAEDGRWVPWEDLEEPGLLPRYRNIFENTALVQLNHRVLGVSTAVTAIALSAVGLLHPATRAVATPQVVRGLRLVGGVATAQASLGIVTLLSYVPLELAAAHQVGSLALMSSGIYLVHSLRYARPALIKGTMTKAMSSGGGGANATRPVFYGRAV